MQRIYFDYAASTPVDPEVERVMEPYFGKVYANAGSTHWLGQQASAAVFNARQKIAKALGCNYKEIIFTGSATEANNLALRGVVVGLVQKSKIKNQKYILKLKIITSTIEHESILETCRDLENQGLVEVVYIPVSKEGIVDIEKLKGSLDERTILVSIMYANNQIGTIQPITEIAKIIRDFRNPKLLFHTDAVQAFQFLPCRVGDLGVDLMTLSAHKIYGPKGIGVLYARKIKESDEKNNLNPIVTGGGQEQNLRSGTENTPSIVGFGEAMSIAEKLRLSEFKRLKSSRDYFWKELKKIAPDIELNGSTKDRLPNNLNIYFPGRPAQDLAIELDLWGLAISPGGAACASRVNQPAYAVEALGFGGDRSKSSLRFSLGRYTTKEEIATALKILKKRFSKN